MERYMNFAPGEYYHLFSRGVEKRKIFLESRDYERFQILLYILNQNASFHISNYSKRGKRDLAEIYKEKRSDSLISILSYSLMPNHFHLLVKENDEGGISKFMGKLLTAYSMYFNTKHERSGPLFVRPFRSKHVEDDVHFKHLFSYIHLNCVDLFEKDWKLHGLQDLAEAEMFLNSYKYSSYPEFSDLAERREADIVDRNQAYEYVSRSPLHISDFVDWYKIEPYS
ncbi:transposase [Candidatus Parcubacteria bacterium]|nr:transposase [Candidatus Parcubacteria bacterium]